MTKKRDTFCRFIATPVAELLRQSAIIKKGINYNGIRYTALSLWAVYSENDNDYIVFTIQT
ncbi:hypothetical protein EV102420_09_00680 [Pseudescherichia vulneris NBRC 102420]|uniref:Uncharacterized protein n=1 Tax=Pseudescherichia vulneris NBRC 102420 TaxID=1115515 RepID=A0A090UZS1_PSEVU|nr:hypothetical protein EV102420_09_00680 [Pseudescherichia vulneris NBRC 102420]